jgi:hypothetical protein
MVRMKRENSFSLSIKLIKSKKYADDAEYISRDARINEDIDGN